MKTFSAVALWLLIVLSVGVMFLGSKWVTTIPEVVSCLLAAAWAIAIMTGRSRAQFAPAFFPLAGFVLWGAIQYGAGITVYHYQTGLLLVYWAGNLAVFFVGLQIFGDSSIRQRFLRALLLFGFAVSALSTLQALTRTEKIYWTFTTEFAGWTLMGPFVYHNQFAAFIELLLPLALYQAMRDREWRMFYVLVSAMFYAAIIVSTSRAGFTLATLEMVAVPVILWRRGEKSITRSRSLPILMAGIIALLAIAAGPEVLAGRFAIKDPYAARREFTVASLSMLRDRPLTGFGLGTWATVYPGYATFDDGTYTNQAHNDWAQWAVEGGVPALLLMIAFAAFTIPAAWRSAWGLGTTAVFIHCWVDYPIQRTAVALVFFLILAAAIRSTAEGQLTVLPVVGKSR